MTEIFLGNFTQQNGRTTASGGIASGLDSAALIEGILESRTLSIEQQTETVDGNTEKLAALSKAQILLDRFKTSADFLRNPPGVRNEANDYFKATNTTLLSNTSIDASTYLSVQSTSGATLGNYTIENITLAQEHIIRKDNFTSDSASVVGNASVTDNYGTSLGTISGNVLNATTPITFANDINANGAATDAQLDVIFGEQNQFDATDTLTVGSTVLTFGGTGGNDLDISGASSLDDKIDVIVNYLNTLTTGDEANSNYTYSRPESSVLRIERDAAGAIATVGSDITVSANFSTGTTDTTQTVGFGSQYKNNGSASGSVVATNALVSASVSTNGTAGVDASSKASINIQFSADNEFNTGDTITFGATTIGFDTSTDVDSGSTLGILSDATLADKLRSVALYMNTVTTGDEAGYSYTFDGTDTIIVTRDAFGSNSTVGTNLALSADFSAVATNQTIQFGSESVANIPTATTLDVAGTDGVDTTAISDAKTTYISSLSGAIDLASTSPIFTAGSSDGDTFTPNSVQFTATVNGETYTSRAVELDGGNIDGSSLGDTIAAGTVITFVKDTQSDTTDGTQDVTFQLVVGDAKTLASEDLAGATAYQAEINTWLNTTNSVSITQPSTVPEFRAGTFSLGGVDINLEEGDNLNVIRSKINAVSELSGVSADVVKVSDNNFSLVLKATESGTENRIIEFGDADSTDPNDPPANTIQFGLDNVAFTRVQNFSDASLDIDGLTVTRSTNTIDDAIEGLTFSLKSDTPVSTTISASVVPDTDQVTQGVIDFLNSYNELKFFVAEQQERDADDNLVEGAVLGDDNFLRDTLRAIDAELTRTVSGLTSGALSTLFEAGIDFIDFPGSDETPAVEDIFTLDEDKFAANLTANFNEVRNVFAFSFSANSSELSVFSRTNEVALNNFKLDIDDTRTSGEQVRVLDLNDNFLFFADYNPSTDAFGNAIPGQGGTISGASGTSLEGLTLVYSGDGTDTITVNATQGIADRIYNRLDSILSENGSLQVEIDSIQSESDRITELIDDEEERLELERELLIARYGRLESFISQINETLRFFESQEAQNNSG